MLFRSMKCDMNLYLFCYEFSKFAFNEDVHGEMFVYDVSMYEDFWLNDM